MNILIAGRDTTAILLSWLFYMLYLHPTTESELSKEIIDFGFNNENTTLSRKDIGKLKFLRAVQNETLRLFPPVPAEFKQAIKDDILPSGYLVKAGDEVGFNPYTIHRLEKYWGPDSETWNPRRWTNLNAAIYKHIQPFQFIPFLGGKRMCLGKNLALMESALVIVRLINKWQFRIIDGPKTYAKSLTMPIKNGLNVIVAKKN